MAETEDTRKDSLWRYIPLSEFARTELPAQDVLGDRIQPVWRYFRHARLLEPVIDRLIRLWESLGGKPDVEPVTPENLIHLPTDLLDRVTPEPHWKSAASAMYSMLEDWISRGREEERKNGNTRWQRIVIDPPFCGTREILRYLAEEHGWPTVDAPSLEDILLDGRKWVSGASSLEGSPLVIPSLEDCYLRHYDGLQLIQELVDWLITNNRFCLIGCGSWAWAYLNAAMNLGPLFPEPYILRALKGTDLIEWFSMPVLESKGREWVFRKMGNRAEPLLSFWKKRDDGTGRVAGKGGEGSADAEFFRQLAGYTLGNPGVARAIWRELMRIHRDAGPEGSRDGQFAENTIWVNPLSDVDLPKMPDDRARSHFFVLHAILLHRSLPPDIIRELLSISTIDVLETLHHLHHLGLLEINLDKAHWEIAAAGYPPIRRELERAGYLVDRI